MAPTNLQLDLTNPIFVDYLHLIFPWGDDESPRCLVNCPLERLKALLEGCVGVVIST